MSSRDLLFRDRYFVLRYWACWGRSRSAHGYKSVAKFQKDGERQSATESFGVACDSRTKNGERSAVTPSIVSIDTLICLRNLLNGERAS